MKVFGRGALAAFLAVVLAVVLAVSVTSCGSNGSSAKSATEPTTGAVIEIKDFKFSPDTLNVKVGDVITVKNNDTADHTVTATDKSFDTGPLKQGQSTTFTITKAGTFDYICSIHDYMMGVIQAS